MNRSLFQRLGALSANNGRRRRLSREQVQRERQKVRVMNKAARAMCAGTTLGGLVVIGIIDGVGGGRMANVAYSPGEALRYAAAIAWRAVVAWWES